MEIKQCQKGCTINQVRAIKFILLVIYSPQYDKRWAVIPSQEVVRLVLNKGRGQHTEIPFECANLSLTSIPEKFRFTDQELTEAVKSAIRSTSRFGEVEKELNLLLGEILKMNSAYKDRIRAALVSGDVNVP